MAAGSNNEHPKLSVRNESNLHRTMTGFCSFIDTKTLKGFTPRTLLSEYWKILPCLGALRRHGQPLGEKPLHN